MPPRKAPSNRADSSKSSSTKPAPRRRQKEPDDSALTNAPQVAEDEDVFQSNAKAQLCELLRNVVESTDPSADVRNGVRQLRSLYHKVSQHEEDSTAAGHGGRNGLEDFLDELSMRLSLLFEHYSSDPAINRVVRLLGEVAVAATPSDREQDDSLLAYLVEYCKKMQFAIDARVRRRTVMLGGVLLQCSARRAKACDDNLEDEDSQESGELSMQRRRVIYTMLRDRQFDKESAIRAEVIRAVAHMQDDEVPAHFVEAVEKSPKDIIVDGLSDVAPDVRQAAVTSLTAKCREHVSALMTVAMSDKNIQAKNLALQSLSRTPLASVEKKRRLDLLLAAVSHSNHKLAQTAYVLLDAWMIESARLDCQSLDDATPSTSYDQKRMVALASLPMMRQIFHESVNEESLFAVLGTCFDWIRRRCEMTTLPVSETVQQICSSIDASSSHAALGARNYKDLLNRGLSWNDRLELVLHWRALAEWACNRSGQDKADRADCLLRLCPPHRQMVELVIELCSPTNNPWDDVELEQDRREEVVESKKTAIVLHLLHLIQLLDSSDTVGMRCWKSLLERLIAPWSWTPTHIPSIDGQEVTQSTEPQLCSPSKALCDAAMKMLLQTFYGRAKWEDALQWTFDQVAVLVSKSMDPDATQMNQTIGLPLSSGLDNQTMAATSNDDIDDYTVRLSACLVSSALRTGLFRRPHAFFEGIRGQIIDRVWAMKDENSPDTIEVRRWAYQICGMLGLLSASNMRSNMHIVKCGLGDLPVIQPVVLCVLAEWCLHFGYNAVANGFNVDETDIRRRLDVSILQSVFRDAVWSEDPDIEMAGCEHTAQLLLHNVHGSGTGWHEFLRRMAMKLFHPSIRQHPRLKGCLSQFFPIFASMKRTNQLLISDALRALVDHEPDENDLELNEEELSRCATYMTYLTSREILSKLSVEPDESPVHTILVRHWIDLLGAEGDAMSPERLNLIAELLASLELSNSDTELEEFCDMAARTIELIENENGGKPSPASQRLSMWVKRMETARRQLQAVANATSEQAPEQSTRRVKKITSMNTPRQLRRIIASASKNQSASKGGESASKSISTHEALYHLTLSPTRDDLDVPSSSSRRLPTTPSARSKRCLVDNNESSNGATKMTPSQARELRARRRRERLQLSPVLDQDADREESQEIE